MQSGLHVPPFPKPRFDYSYDLAHEVAALRDYRKNKPGRQIPAKGKGRLLVATWNVANLGVQDRLDSDYALIAEVMSWFDLVAVQEVNDDLRGIEAIHSHLPTRYDLLFSDASGNRERQGFLYDTRKVSRLREVGRVAIPPSQLPKIAVAGATTAFAGFDRGPYLASFESGAFRFALLNVHLFYGSEAPADLDRRTLETFAVAWWADQDPPRQELLCRRRRSARRLQPSEGCSRRSHLRRARRARADDSGAQLPDRLGDRLRQPVRPDRLLPGHDEGPVQRRLQRLRLRRRALPGPVGAAHRGAVPRLHALSHLRPPPTLGGVPDRLTRRKGAATLGRPGD